MTGRMISGEQYEVTATGCWNWLGHLDRNGYGKGFDPNRPAGKRYDWAHRIAYRQRHGSIPDGHELDHTCQNTRCVNPDHLDAVTHVDHARRTMERLGKDALHTGAARLRRSGLTYGEIADALGYAGRTSAYAAVRSAIDKELVGASDVPPMRFLDAQDREDIRDIYALGVSQLEIASWYGLHSSQVSRVCNGRTSGHSGPQQ